MIVNTEITALSSEKKKKFKYQNARARIFKYFINTSFIFFSFFSNKNNIIYDMNVLKIFHQKRANKHKIFLHIYT